MSEFGARSAHGPFLGALETLRRSDTTMAETQSPPLSPRATKQHIKQLENDVGMLFLAISTMQTTPGVQEALNAAYAMAPADGAASEIDAEAAQLEAEFSLAHLADDASTSLGADDEEEYASHDFGSRRGGDDSDDDMDAALVHTAEPQSPVASRRFNGFVR